jgi:ribosomal protein S18 acetylase RimI-like enzyme
METFEDLGVTVRVRRIHRRDMNRVWEFLKLVFREVQGETVEYQRPRTKSRFLEVYEEEGTMQLVFELVPVALPAIKGKIPKSLTKPKLVGYAECAFEVVGRDSWINERYFRRKGMRPLFVEELAVHPGMQGRGVGAFMLEQLEHLARLRGCSHLVLEVAENNDNALKFYRARSFMKLDAAVFMAKRVQTDDELLEPRALRARKTAEEP